MVEPWHFQILVEDYRDHLDASTAIDVFNNRQTTSTTYLFFSIFLKKNLLIFIYKDYARVRTGTTTTPEDDEEQWKVEPMYAFFF